MFYLEIRFQGTVSVWGVNQGRREGGAIRGCVTELATSTRVCLLVLGPFEKLHEISLRTAFRGKKEGSICLQAPGPCWPKAVPWGVNAPAFLGGTHMRAKWVPVGISEHSIRSCGAGRKRRRACLRGGTVGYPCLKPAEGCLETVTTAMEELRGEVENIRSDAVGIGFTWSCT